MRVEGPASRREFKTVNCSVDVAVAGGGPTRIYRNNGGTFVDSGAVLPDSSNAAIAWGDFDNDGDLDLLNLRDGKIYRKGMLDFKRDIAESIDLAA